jgi:hypothetical protein
MPELHSDEKIIDSWRKNDRPWTTPVAARALDSDG